MSNNGQRDINLVLSGGLLVDGSGGPAYPADVGITGSFIVALGLPGAMSGREVVDVTGHVVAPGFIDIHSHADYTLFVDGRAHSAIGQGITSVVTGNCGHGAAPVTDISRSLIRTNVPGWARDWDVSSNWRSFGDYLAALRDRGVAPNVFPLVSHGSVRLAVAGYSERELEKAEIATACALIREAMDAGAVGLSTGLEYAPGLAATTSELVDLAKVVGQYQGLYATHCRDRTDRIVEAADEAVTIARRSNCRLQLSHFVRRPTDSPRWLSQEAVELVRRAGSNDFLFKFDVFPFDYGPTPISTFMLPMWVRQGPPSEVAERLTSSEVRRRLLSELCARMSATLESGVAETMCIASDGKDGSLVGFNLADLAHQWRRPIPEVLLKILIEAGENFYEATVVERWADWRDLREALASPDYLIMGDGVTGALDGPLADYAFSLADWGYAPEMLGRFVRQEGLVSVEEAVARMTSGPAAQVGLTDRGTIAPGRRADVVVFEPSLVGCAIRPDALIDRPRGIEHVLVNGKFVMRAGILLDERPGVVGIR